MLERTVVVIDPCETTEIWLRSFGNRRGDLKFEFAAAEALSRRSWDMAPAAILVELRQNDSPGLHAIQYLHSAVPSVPIIAISPAVHLVTVVQAMKLGAVDYLTTPLDDADLEQALGTRLGPRHASKQGPVEANPWDSGPSVHPRVRAIRDIALRVAATDVPVLISGESGVGKEVLAQYIHQLSTHRRGPFIKVNCAAIPSDLLESELFGHERGAFTGAGGRKPGMFGLAGNGTIMLDEIGELAGPLQPKLLHVLQDGEYMRLGGVAAIRANARILAATNQSLETAVRRGEFRQDLLFRLNVVHIDMPPLRARLGDLPALCLDLMARHGGKYAIGSMPALPDRLMNAFLAYSWPGNVRQLENLIKQFLIFRDEQMILDSMKDAIHLDEKPATEAIAPPSRRAYSLKHVGAEAADRAEKELVLGLLEERRWNRKQVARDLSVSYKTLLSRLHRWQIPGRTEPSSRMTPYGAEMESRAPLGNKIISSGGEPHSSRHHGTYPGAD